MVHNALWYVEPMHMKSLGFQDIWNSGWIILAVSCCFSPLGKQWLQKHKSLAFARCVCCSDIEREKLLSACLDPRVTLLIFADICRNLWWCWKRKMSQISTLTRCIGETSRDPTRPYSFVVALPLEHGGLRILMAFPDPKFLPRAARACRRRRVWLVGHRVWWGWEMAKICKNVLLDDTFGKRVIFIEIY